MKVLIIEDEAAAYNNIKQILKHIDPAIEIAASFDTVTGSVLWLRSNPAPDLIFMDIQLADGTAFNIIECVNIESPVIFTTAFDEYAIKAFQVNSIDYVLRPITLESLKKALDKLNRLRNFGFQRIMDKLDTSFGHKEYRKRVLVPVKDKIISLATDDIAFFYNTNGVTEITSMSNCTYRVDKSLDSIITNLNPAQFIRANRQLIVSKAAVKDLTVWFDSRLLVNMLVDTPEQVLVSKNRALEFKNWFAL